MSQLKVWGDIIDKSRAFRLPLESAMFCFWFFFFKKKMNRKEVKGGSACQI
jgi:hypothetical protein